jgi:hypothetical protein
MGDVLQWTGYLCGALVAGIICNILRQGLPRKKHEPPMVFHWVPFIGNAITYGTNPYQFLVDCRQKVNALSLQLLIVNSHFNVTVAWRYLHICPLR